MLAVCTRHPQPAQNLRRRQSRPSIRIPRPTPVPKIAAQLIEILGFLNGSRVRWADAFYAAGKIVNGLLKQGNHLVSRVRSNAVAYLPAQPPKTRRKRGRPKRYGTKIRLK